MRNRKYKDPYMQKVYDGYLKAAYSLDSFLYYKCQPRRGSSTREAFWKGYDGTPNLLYARNTAGYAAYFAGKDFKTATMSCNKGFHYEDNQGYCHQCGLQLTPHDWR